MLTRLSELGLNDRSVTVCKPCGLSTLVFNIQKADFLSHCQTFKYTSPLKLPSPLRASTVAIQSPAAETATLTILDGSNALSSRRDTRFEGETSSSETSLEEEGEYICNEEGCDEGNKRVELRPCIPRGTCCILGPEADEGSLAYTISQMFTHKRNGQT